MSNSLNQNPISLTSVMSTSYKSQMEVAPPTGWGKGSQFTIKVIKLFWLSPASIGDKFIITDPQSSLVLWSGTCEVALQSQVFDWSPAAKIWADFICTKMDSGTLFIQLD